MTKWTRKRLMSALGWLTPASAKSSLAIQKEPAKIHITVSGTSDGGAEGQLEGRKRKEGRKRTVCHRLGASLPPVGASSTLCETGTEQGVEGTECWHRTAFYHLKRPPAPSKVPFRPSSAAQNRGFFAKWEGLSASGRQKDMEWDLFRDNWEAEPFVCRVKSEAEQM